MTETTTPENIAHTDVLLRNVLIDPIHGKLGDWPYQLIEDMWVNKYKQPSDESYAHTCTRVVKGVYAEDTSKPGIESAHRMEMFMKCGLFIPGGRIIAGAGTDKLVTLMNCYVNETVKDSMTGIMHSLNNVAYTLQQGGGIGTDFSTLRPNGAALKRTGKGSAASGPVPFMRTWNALSNTIKSAGDRRGAMMATISDTHPDLLEFIRCKQQGDAMLQFNISVLVSDAFMSCVERGDDWHLFFASEPAGERDTYLSNLDFVDGKGVEQFVYATYPAKDIWDEIMQSAYDFAEPGVIFIDTVNCSNNLQSVETIRCTNPCGEQPLPPNGACDLGAINLSRMVKNPFESDAVVDHELLRAVATEAVRFLDNVIDVTAYPLEDQKQEQINKRRLGLGITGLADMLAQVGVVYGSPESVVISEAVMYTIAHAAYEASAMLADEKGTFPLWDEDMMKQPFIAKLDPDLKAIIQDLGLRNGVLLTIAPTGTTSLILGNVSSGLEPTFAHVMKRKVFSSNNEHEAAVYDDNTSYLYRLYRDWFQGAINLEVDSLPAYMVTAQDLEVDAHLAIMAACQKWVDASISKTINLPEDYTIEAFSGVYTKAYALGCKGCTTYRPTELRGSVISVAKPKAEPEVKTGTDWLTERPDMFAGATYKIKWPSWNAAIYMTINHDEEDNPREMFIVSKDARHQEWMTALTVMISAIMRKSEDINFIPHELKSIQSMSDGNWIDGKFYGSLLARIGEVIEQHYAYIRGEIIEKELPEEVNVQASASGQICPQCNTPALIMSEGCEKCTSCGYSKCG